MNNSKNSLKTIFVIDDDVFQHNIIKHLLGEDKYNVVFISGGIEAIYVLLRTRPDLILLDINMPDFDGLEVLRKIKQYRHISGVPIIMISGMCEKRVVMQSMLHGAIDFIAKPFDHNILLNKIRELLIDVDQIPEEISSTPRQYPPLISTTFSNTLPLIPIVPTLLRNLSVFLGMIELNDSSIENYRHEIVRLIELDAETSTIILKIINSPLYGSNQNVKSISDALESIGFIHSYL